LSGTPARTALASAAATYASRTRQDDAGIARWFIDKQPLNFRYVNLMLAMFPAAKVIHCRRGARDNALSLWMQCFLEPVHDYSYDFDDIAWVMRAEARLMAHWQSRYPEAIRDVPYEAMVADPQAVVAGLAAWLGLPPRDGSDRAARPAAAISTASLWQARQPIYARAIGRWKHYAAYVPELLRIAG
jgi:hypothetical protein